jgi:hypothetical protein
LFVGTIGGDGFKHFTNTTFDFHVAEPSSWECEGCKVQELRQSSEQTTLEWHLHPKSGSTHLDTTFISGFPAQTADELLAAIAAQTHTDPKDWFPFHRGDGEGRELAGFSNKEAPDAANDAVEYYWVDRQLVIRLDWQKDTTDTQSALELDAVKSSIDRASAPPRVTGVRSEGAMVVKPGDKACILVGVDDLLGTFKDTEPSTVELFGMPEHWSFKTVAWSAADSAYRICVTVTSSFGANGLNLKSFSLDSDDGGSIWCSTPTSAGSQSLQLRCSRGIGSPETIEQQVARVDNPAIDEDGPQISSVSYDAASGSLRIEAADPSGVFGGEIFMGKNASGDDLSVVIYPDQIQNGEGVPIDSLVVNGWNKVDRILLYDKVGNVSMLRVPKGGGLNYELVSYKGQVSASPIGIVNFFKNPSYSGRSRR